MPIMQDNLQAPCLMFHNSQVICVFVGIIR
uniref:Uncharacterized protein n=1 Tax=Setaria italica TaxID=4555 RepID=K3YF61_SETIT